jgi:single-strand DNA-binding protein
MNTVILIGRLTRDPELRYTNSGHAVANFTLAVDRPFSKNKETDFIPIIVWQKQAENCAEYLLKGSQVAVEGRLQVRGYEDKQGNKRSATEVVASSVQFLDTRKRERDLADQAADMFDGDSIPF